MRVSPDFVRAAAVLAVLASLAACGGDDDAADTAAEQAEQAAADAEQAADAALEDVAGGSLPDDVEELIEGALDSGSLPDLPEMGAEGDGSCSVTLSGAHSGEWTESQNSGSGVVSYWFGDTERSIYGEGLAIIANCSGDAGTFSLLSSSDADESSVPMGPGTYELAPSGPLGSSGLFSIMLALNDADAIFGVAEPGGTLEITELSDETFSFVLDVPVVDSLAEMTGGVADPSQLHVEFTLSDTGN